MSRALPRRALVTLLVVMSWAVGARAQDADALFQEGIDAFRRGENAAAVEAFKAALAQDPSNEEAFRLWQRVEQDVLLQMLVERGELGQLTERLLERAKVGRRVVMNDPGGADEVVSRLLGGDEAERRQALLTLQGMYGEWSVPALVGPLGDRSDINRRVLAIEALVRLGDVAVPALIQVLRSDDELTRMNAAAVLGAVRDPRAAAALAWMASTDEAETARLVAQDALDKLGPELSVLGIVDRDAAGLSLALARRWLAGDADLVKPYDTGRVSWSWSDGGLTGEAVLGGLYALGLAESSLRQALAAGGSGPQRAHLAAVHAAQKAEIELASELEALSDNELLEAARGNLDGIDLNLALAGQHRGPALGLLLELGQVPAAKALMGAMGRSTSEVEALRRALDSKDAGLAIAAAMALGRQGGSAPRVVALLGHALTQVPDRIVVSLGETGLSGSRDGWELVQESQAARGLLRAKSFPPKDVVVVQAGLDGLTLDTLVHGLTNDPRTASVPLIVVTDDVDEVQALYGEQVARVVSAASFDDVADVAGDRSGAERQAMDRARAAAHILGTMPVAAVAHAGPQIAVALASSADDDVKIAVLGLAGRGGVVESLPAVEALVLAGGSEELQIATLGAAARLWALAGQPSGSADELRGALEAALADGEGDLARAAAEALGALGGEPGALVTSAG